MTGRSAAGVARWGRIALALGLLGVLGGCSGDDDGDDPGDRPRTVQPGAPGEPSRELTDEE
ncbi:MAG TPA: hypothetical protein VIL36_14670, partial [Acidimicrobiales bacterium]